MVATTTMGDRRNVASQVLKLVVQPGRGNENKAMPCQRRFWRKGAYKQMTHMVNGKRPAADVDWRCVHIAMTASLAGSPAIPVNFIPDARRNLVRYGASFPAGPRNQ